MIEYLYIDKPRLDRYYEQISSPVKYDKVPVWKVALGLTGPKVESTQVRSGRSPTTHEKTQKFIEHVEEHDLASSERTSLDMRRRSEEEEERPFILETLSARRVQIKKDDSVLNIWVSIRPDKVQSEERLPSGALYLIEDFRGDDEYHQSFSGYSSLYLLTEELAWLVHTPISDPLEKLRKQDNATQHFALDPLGTLVSIGAQIGPERRIRAIYRFRASCIEMEGETTRALTTIGYPIVIHEE